LRAIQFSGPGGPETIAEVDIPVPVPGAGQVAIAVRYAGLNFVDVLARRGTPGYAAGWPYVPGMEVAGEVAALGSGVAGSRPTGRVLLQTGSSAPAEGPRSGPGWVTRTRRRLSPVAFRSHRAAGSTASTKMPVRANAAG
jgi:NADPH:quinone reductase